MYDVRPGRYGTVIRDLIKHENDVTNHRIMWLLIVQIAWVWSQRMDEEECP